MSLKLKTKIIVDLIMEIVLLLLMGYAIVGESLHEWLGIAMGVITIVHNLLNLQWYKNIFKGKYSPLRIAQTFLNLAILICVVLLMVSGIMMSNYAVPFLRANSGMGFARTAHLVCSYWGFSLMAIHIGMHGKMFIAMLTKATKSDEKNLPAKAFCGAMIIIAVYGVYAFFNQGIWQYMLLINQYVFFDFGAPIALFFADYIAISALFMCVGYFVEKALRALDEKLKK